MHIFLASVRRRQGAAAFAGCRAFAPSLSRHRSRLANVVAIGMVLCTSLVVPAAYAVHPMVVLEDSYELKPANTVWPETATGAVVLPGCEHCKQDRYHLGAAARFLVGQQPVAYREFLVAVRGRNAAAVFIAIERATGEVSRATVMP